MASFDISYFVFNRQDQVAGWFLPLLLTPDWRRTFWSCGICRQREQWQRWRRGIHWWPHARTASTWEWSCTLSGVRAPPQHKRGWRSRRPTLLQQPQHAEASCKKKRYWDFYKGSHIYLKWSASPFFSVCNVCNWNDSCSYHVCHSSHKDFEETVHFISVPWLGD